MDREIVFSLPPAITNYYVFWPLLCNYPKPFKVIIQRAQVSRGSVCS